MRRATTVLMVATLAASPLMVASAQAASALGSTNPVAPSADAFRAFLDAFRTDALAGGIDAHFYDATIAGLAPDPTVAALTRAQPEFAKPIGAYLAAQVTPARIATGRTMLARYAAVLDEIERRSGVPRTIVVAVWGLESNYGTAAGNKDVIRSLATLAAMNYRPTLYRAELVAALSLLQAGDVRREGLKGSWAGAMGQPQFMPSSFIKYATDGDGDGRRDIWTSVPDALASIANFIRAQGWQSGQPWGFEVRLPSGFDHRISRGSFAEWSARGLQRADGQPMPESGAGILLFPAGAAGPAFLVTENFEVLKTYNFSDAYVLSVGQLADRMEGRAAIQASWPSAPSMTRPARIALQARLAELGYAVDNREGRISLALRDVIRLAQARVGAMPDGNPTDLLLENLNQIGTR